MSFDMNVPIPKRTQDRDLYGVRNMPVGASKFFPYTDKKTKAAIRSCATSFNAPCSLTCRIATEDGVDGFRMWRIA